MGAATAAAAELDLPWLHGGRRRGGRIRLGVVLTMLRGVDHAGDSSDLLVDGIGALARRERLHDGLLAEQPHLLCVGGEQE